MSIILFTVLTPVTRTLQYQQSLHQEISSNLKTCLSKQNVFAKKTPPKTESNTPPGTSNVSHDKTPLREQADKHTSKPGDFVLVAGNAF